jgi:hypothetical protein
VLCPPPALSLSLSLSKSSTFFPPCPSPSGNMKLSKAAFLHLNFVMEVLLPQTKAVFCFLKFVSTSGKCTFC